MKLFRITTVSLLLLAFSCPIMAKGQKVDICHWDEDGQVFFVINVSVNAVKAHMKNHGDSYPATYWTDVDGDGFGDAAGLTDPCPNAGFVDNALDCDDGDAGIHPDAEELCDDEIDNDCDGEVDEGCAPACPCFTAADIDETYAQWQTWDYEQVNYTCNNGEGINTWYYDNFQTTMLWFWGQNYSPSQYTENENDYFQAYGYDDSIWYGPQYYCTHYWGYVNHDYTTGEHESDYIDGGMYITPEEVQGCRQLILDWVDANGLTCTQQ